MLDELRARFLPEFIAETRAQLRTALALIPATGPAGKGSAETISNLMHTITGKALLIGAQELALLARAAGGAARRYLETNNSVALVACARTLRTLARTLDELKVPVAAPAPPAAGAAESPRQGAAPAQSPAQTRVLVVDDSPFNAALMREALVSEGFDTTAVGDDFALVLQNIYTLRPHMLLVDWLMPGCDTRMLCRHIRSTPELARIRVLLFTSLPEREAAAEALAMDIDGAVSKEQGMSAIVDRVRALSREPR